MILYTDLPPEPKLEQRVLSDEDFSKVENEDEDDDGDEEEKKEEESFWSRYMRDRARSKFGVDLPSRLKVVEVKTTRVLDPSLYPRFTLLLQSLSSVIVGAEALAKLTPQVYVDTCGVPFVEPSLCET